MPVYVDDMRAPALISGTRGKWCHLIADSSDELAAFAAILRLQPTWVQFPGTFREHYDVSESIRRRAIEHGAIPISLREAGRLFRTRVAVL